MVRDHFVRRDVDSGHPDRITNTLTELVSKQVLSIPVSIVSQTVLRVTSSPLRGPYYV